MESLNKIDIGICLAHLYIANKDNFSFKTMTNKQIKGYTYVGSIKQI